MLSDYTCAHKNKWIHGSSWLRRQRKTSVFKVWLILMNSVNASYVSSCSPRMWRGVLLSAKKSNLEKKALLPPPSDPLVCVCCPFYPADRRSHRQQVKASAFWQSLERLILWHQVIVKKLFPILFVASHLVRIR